MNKELYKQLLIQHKLNVKIANSSRNLAINHAHFVNQLPEHLGIRKFDAQLNVIELLQFADNCIKDAKQSKLLLKSLL